MKGWELLKEIAEGNIKEGTRFKANCYTFIVKCGYLYKECNITREYADSYELMWDFELIEDKEEINIQEIDELTEIDSSSLRRKKINELIQAVKQLDKQVKENK